MVIHHAAVRRSHRQSAAHRAKMPTVSVALTIIAYDPTVERCRQLSRGQHKTCLTIPATAVFLAFDGLSAPIWGVGPSVPYEVLRGMEGHPARSGSVVDDALDALRAGAAHDGAPLNSRRVMERAPRRRCVLSPPALAAGRRRRRRPRYRLRARPAQMARRTMRNLASGHRRPETECSLAVIATHVIRSRSIRLRRIRRTDDEAQLAVVDQLVFR